MAIVAADIQYRFSVAAATGDSTAGTAPTSLGDQVSTTQITDATLNNLWDDVSGAESAAGDTEYRGIFVLNNHATLTLQNATIALQSETAGGGAITIATDNIAVSAKGSGSAQMGTIANESSAPGAASAFGAGPLALGDIGPGQVKGVWVKRVVAPGASALNPDGAILRVTGDTLP
jgi:hypothetical protein